MGNDTEHRKTNPAQSEIGRGTPPARTPEALPDTDIEPDQAPVRDTPEVGAPGADSAGGGATNGS
ncbi:hypothetical protein WKR88_17965 [Trinickia caryophylli]|uniref:Uncharacterized protein n=1 Tax=Trinickia caryophylli TaxID=28094 RepID=A0A1X7DYP1_TRICW|nr:hypothetical protein [Trinickia caryophylli]PMS14124.1 hypothetical protein C0Z17_00865 [Trinickia caryophylli]TRX17823.1 hypothetical protein FNF07_06005 [Trinickia caryophylli]WQE11409.1 hypothetical protein U0034_16905 [Trinickia caryophylli]SMF24221.1 hypothetical protein SAMN06295900_104266 [Trinickia caryophylli]GLU32571.1 hypothetical protein Busp01_24130 [Trinickia caryophylli]